VRVDERPKLPGASRVDTWTDIGGAAALIIGLHRNPLVNARPVVHDEDALPSGLTRD
jgi:hypothetical protein